MFDIITIQQIKSLIIKFIREAEPFSTLIIVPCDEDFSSFGNFIQTRITKKEFEDYSMVASGPMKHLSITNNISGSRIEVVVLHELTALDYFRGIKPNVVIISTLYSLESIDKLYINCFHCSEHVYYQPDILVEMTKEVDKVTRESRQKKELQRMEDKNHNFVEEMVNMNKKKKG